MQASAAVERLTNCLVNIDFAAKNADGELSDIEKESIAYINSKKNEFIDAMDDDLNTADAIGYLFEMTRDINSVISNRVSAEYIENVKSVYVDLCELLGFGNEKNDDDCSLWSYIFTFDNCFLFCKQFKGTKCFKISRRNEQNILWQTAYYYIFWW